MKRRIHNIMAAFLCVCLLVSYIPTQAIADSGTDELGEFVNGQASTDVKVIIGQNYDFLFTTESFAATRDQIANDKDKDGNPQYDLNVKITGGTAPYTYTWTKSVAGKPDVETVQTKSSDALSDKYELSKHAKDLAAGSECTFKIVVKDSNNSEIERSIKVIVSDKYDYKTLEKDNVAVTADIHYMAELSVSSIGSTMPIYSDLQEAVGGKKIINALQVGLTANPSPEEPLYVGEPTVDFVVEGMDGKTITVVCIDAKGKKSVFDNVAVAGGKASIVMTDTQGVFGAIALAYDAPGATHTITSSVKVDPERSIAGGQISPLGTRTYPEGATPSYILLPDSGYVIDQVFIDGAATGKSIEGNTYTFEPLQGDPTAHSIEASFKKASSAGENVKLTARVENGNGKVRIDDKNVEGENVSVEVEKATSATIKFIPNSGYVIDTVKVNNAPVTVMGDTYLLSAVLGEVSGETTVVVTYKEGVKPPVLYHTVTTTTDGAGGTISESRDDVEHGKFATVYFYPDENYRLSSVTVGEKDVTSQVSENKLTIENIVTDLTVKATFEYIEHTVNASAGEGGTISPAGEKKVKDGESLAYYFNPEKGYELSSLLLQSGTDAAVDVTADVKGGVYLLENIRGNYTLTAAFVPSSVPPEDVYYTITASAGGGGKISPEGVSRLKAGESQTFSLTPDDTHKVKQVIVNGTSVAFNGFSYTINNVRQNTTIHVEFEAADTPPELPKSYSVETSAGLGGSVSPKGKTTVYEHGSVLVKFLPDAGYQLRAVNVNGVEVPAGDIVDNSYRVYVDKYKDTSATAPVPVSVDAMFEPIKTPPTDPDYCMLTTKVGAGSGTVSPEGTTKVPYGKDQTIHFIPDSGNRIKSVTVGSDLVDLNEIKNNTYLLKGVTKDTTVTVEYENQPGPVVSQHTVTATATAGGTISPEGVTTVNDGGSLTYTFTAQEGYKLFSVLVGSQTVSVVGSSYTLTGISNDCTITAVFKENSLPVDKKYHTIHASAAAGGKISPAGDVRVASGKDMTFYFQPDNGKVVDTVTVDGKETTSPAGNSYTFPSVTGDSSINVTFREKGGTDPVPPTVYWTLTATSTTGGAISPSGETQVTPGGQMLYTIIADEGYELKTLYVDNKPVADFSGDTYRFSAVTKEHSIHAEFAKKSSTPDPTVRHTVTASVTDETSGSISPKGETSVPANGTQTFYFTPAGDNGVKSITITKGKDSDKTTQTFAYTGLSYTLTGINADTSIEVTFGSGGIKPPVPLMYEVTTTITDGGGTVSPGNSKVAKGGSLLLTFTPDAGYVLKLVKQGDKDITTQVKADGSYRLTNVTENTTITATFEKGINGNNYRMVSVSAGEGGTISPAGEMRIAKGGVQSFTVVPAEKKELDKITIQYADKAAQEISTDELQKVVDTGYFVFENATELDFSCKIVASFKDRADAPAPDPAKYVTLNTTATTGGAISPSGSMTVAKGSSVLYTLTPDAGYKLSSVIVGDKPVDAALIANNTYMHEATSDAAIKATFVRTSENPEPGYYQVTTSVGEATDGKSSGTISPSGITRVKAGESQTFTFIPNTGCTLDTVTVGGEKVAVDGFTYTLFDVTEDTAIVATFKVAGGTDPEPPAMATIKASASAGGSISPVGTTKAAVGTSPLFTLTPDAGYHIASVVVDGTAIDADKLVNNTYRFDPVEANKDYTIVANYEANPVKPVDPASYRVFASVVNGEGGQISPAGEQKVAAGASQSFSFLPDTGYVVDKVWVKNSPIEPTLDLSFVPEGSIYTLFGVNSEMYIAVSFKKSSDPNPPVDTCTIKSSSTAGGSISPEGETTVAAGSSLTYTFTAF
ncbi:MAG: hypothetical protein RR672_07835, partial [Raoultibacter sp.]